MIVYWFYRFLNKFYAIIVIPENKWYITFWVTICETSYHMSRFFTGFTINNMLFTLRKAKKVKMDGFTAFLYNSKSEFPVVSTVYVDCTKCHEKAYVKGSYRLYFVLKGKGKFKVGN